MGESLVDTTRTITINGARKWDSVVILVAFKPKEKQFPPHRDGSLVAPVMILQAGIGAITKMDIGTTRDWIPKGLMSELLR